MPIVFVGDPPRILFVAGQIAMDPACCCLDYQVGALIDWGPLGEQYPDFDLYGQEVGQDAVYFGRRSVGAMILTIDAHPNCSTSPLPPEISGGAYTQPRTFRFWFNQYSDCCPPAPPPTQLIRVDNHSVVPIKVNGTKVDPGMAWEHHQIAYAGYNTRAVPDFTGGTEVKIERYP